MNPSNVSLPTYFKNPTSTTLSSKVAARIDEIYTAEAQSGVLTRGTGHLMKLADFGGHRVLSIYEREIIQPGTYDRNAIQPLGNPRPVNAKTQTFAITQTATLNDKIDVLNERDTQGILNAQAHIRDEVKHALIPMYDSHVFSTATNFAAANSYVTTVSSGKDVYHDGVVAGKVAFDTRTQATVDDACLIASIDFVGKLRRSDKFVRDNEVSQVKQVYKGMVGMIDGLEVVQVDPSRFGTTYAAMIIGKRVLDHIRKIANFRVNNMAEGFFGSLIQYLSYYDTFIARNRGAAIQLIDDNS